jgi:hypothetical protein
MWWCLSTLGPAKFILTVPHSVLVIHVAPDPHHRFPSPKLNGDDEERCFPPQRPPSASQISPNCCLKVLLQLPSSTVCSQIDHMYIYTVTLIMHGILWCSKSGDCNKAEYDRPNALLSWNRKNHCSENVTPSLPQSCTEVSARFEVPLRPAQRSLLLLKSPADLPSGCTCYTIWQF